MAKLNRLYNLPLRLLFVLIIIFVILVLVQMSNKQVKKEGFTEKVKVLGELMNVGEKVAILDPICSCTAINSDGCYCSDDPKKGISCDCVGVGPKETWIVGSNGELTGKSGRNFNNWNTHHREYEIQTLKEARKVIPEKRDNKCWNYSERH